RRDGAGAAAGRGGRRRRGSRRRRRREGRRRDHRRTSATLVARPSSRAAAASGWVTAFVTRHDAIATLNVAVGSARLAAGETGGRVPAALLDASPQSGARRLHALALGFAAPSAVGLGRLKRALVRISASLLFGLAADPARVVLRCDGRDDSARDQPSADQ